MVNLLPDYDSIILMNVVDGLLFGPVDIPLFRIVYPSVSPVFKRLLNANPNLGFVLNLWADINKKITEVYQKGLH